MTATAQPAKRQDRTTLVLLLVAAFVAVGGIGFAIGHLTGGSTAAAANGGTRSGFVRPSLAPGQTFNVGQFGGGSGAFARGGLAGGVSGTVASISGSTMTITLANGSTVTVDLTGSTTYHNETAASSSDVQVGSSVTVQIDTSALASASPNPAASGGQTLTAKDVLITTP
ncbi:MAG: hypothetical protein ABSA21_05870 [Candidatus Limnocylindrales bacterium]|jgi:hypothetical protein